MFPIGDQNEPGRGLAIWSIAFIVINVLVFVLLQLPSEEFTYGYAAVPLEITTGQDLTDPYPVEIQGERVAIPQEPGPDPIQLTLLTSMFMHGGWLHLGGNMLFLWVFGDNVEHRVGRLIYPVFYLICGLAASVAQILTNPDSPIPTLGASGAISGVLGAYLVLFPQNQVLVFLFRVIVPVPAIVAIGMWAVLQFINGIGSIAITDETGGGVAYWAHIGGFVTGALLGLFFRGLRGGRAPRYAYG
jgi:membrane associated rhomboid family serine protease